MSAIRQFLARVKASGVSIIFISHRLDEVLEISDRVTVLRDGVLIGTLSREQITGKDGKAKTKSVRICKKCGEQID